MTALRHAVRQSLLVWAALVALLALTCASAYLALGAWNSVANLVIAALKALLVAVFFMHLRGAPALLRMVAMAALLTLFLLLGLSQTDYATRVNQVAPVRQAPPAIHPKG